MKRDLSIVGGLIGLAGLAIGLVVAMLYLLGDSDQTTTIPPKTERFAELPKKKEEPKKLAELVKKPMPKPPANADRPTDRNDKKVNDPRETKKQEEKKSDATSVAKMPEEKKQEEKKQEIAKAEVKVEPKAEPKVEPKAEPKVEPKDDAKTPPVKLVVLGNLFRINDPDGEFNVEVLNRGKEITLLGKVKTLKIAGANENSILDASRLEAQEVIFVGNINSGARITLGKAHTVKIADVNNGSLIDASEAHARAIILAGSINSGSTVKLHAPQGTIEFAGELNDRSQLEIDAPAGKVLFRGRDASSINSSAKVRIIAKDVELRSAVNGPQTQLDITLTKDGSLKVERLHGGVRLLYRKADASDPQPRIDRGDVDPQAEFRELPPERK